MTQDEFSKLANASFGENPQITISGKNYSVIDLMHLYRMNGVTVKSKTDNQSVDPH